MAQLVRRTVSVLAAICDKPLSLNELHKATNIHRSTLLRILDTLVLEGLVRRSGGDDKYRATLQLRGWGGRISMTDQLAEVASAMLQDHADIVKWPTDILVKHTRHPCLIVIETNRPRSAFPVKPNQIGHTVPLLPSAAGRAYLAFLDQKKQMALLNYLCGWNEDTHSRISQTKALASELACIRKKGFGTRASAFGGGDFLKETIEHDGLLALAVPVLYENRVIAVINSQWNSKAYDEAEFAELYLSKQIELANSISARLK